MKPLETRKIILGVLLFSSTLTVMAGAIIGPVINLIKGALSVGPSKARFIITTHGVFVFLLSPVTRIIIDKIGARRPYVIGLLLYGLAGGSGLFIGSYLPLLVSRALLGVGVAFIFTSVTVMILQLFEGKEKDRVMGLRGSSNSIGAAVWPLLGGALGTISWHLPFAVYLVGVPWGCSHSSSYRTRTQRRLEEIAQVLCFPSSEKIPCFTSSTGSCSC